MEDLKEVAEKYTYRVFWSEEDQVYICATSEMPSLSCHADTAEKALKESKSLVLDMLQEMAALGEDLPEPFSIRKYSGKFIVRTTEELHRKLSVEAQEKGISINRLINSKLSNAS